VFSAQYASTSQLIAMIGGRYHSRADISHGGTVEADHVVQWPEKDSGKKYI